MIVRDLTKTYDGRKVLDVKHFEFEKGRIYAVVGANGSGKSTFAKVLAGVISSDEANCILRDKTCVVRYSPQKGYAFRMSTLKNVTMAGKGKRDREKAKELLKSLDMEHLMKTPAHKLSGGETAKMALARVMMEKCDYLILDEPCAAMDVQSTLKTEELVKAYCEKCGCAVIIITHSLKQAERISDRVLYFEEGILTESGASAEILHNPKSEKTRAFLDFYTI
ncbi:MAG: ATP-binding cassette domain-containing protein [Oscillospiraceae bacterium]|nr:ATP-binding cassette domain-containing protein [Oscillospiraceae bacterium]